MEATVMNQKTFIAATLPVWAIIALISAGILTFTPAILSIIMSVFLVYLLSGQMARCTDIGFGPWQSTILVLAMFVFEQLLNMAAPTIQGLGAGTVVSYAFPLALMIIPTSFARS